MTRAFAQPALLWVASLTALIGAYAVVSSRAQRPDLIPPLQDIAWTFGALVGGGDRQPTAAGDPHAGHAGHHMSASDQVDTLVQQGVTLQVSLAISTARVLFGLIVGLPLGILIGVVLAWSRRADDYLHPIYVLVRSVPPLALITYIMLWLGHSEAHRLIPIVYAVATTAVIPTYHAVRDVGARYLVAARSLGARGRLLLTKVVIPAASPAVLSGLRYAVAIAWMTAVGAEMLMAENGMGNLLVGGGMWSSRMQTRSDPAGIMAGGVTLAAPGRGGGAGPRARPGRGPPLGRR